MDRINQFFARSSSRSEEDVKLLSDQDVIEVKTFSATYEPLQPDVQVRARSLSLTDEGGGIHNREERAAGLKQLRFRDASVNVEVDRYLFKPHIFEQALKERQRIPGISESAALCYQQMRAHNRRVGELIKSTLNEYLYPVLCDGLANGQVNGNFLRDAFMRIKEGVLRHHIEEFGEDSEYQETIEQLFDCIELAPAVFFTCYLGRADQNVKKMQKEKPGPYSLLVPMHLIHEDKSYYFLQNIGRWLGVIGFIVLAYYLVSIPTENGVPRGLAILDKGDFSATLGRLIFEAKNKFNLSQAEAVERMLKNDSFVTELNRGKEPAFETEVHEVSKEEQEINGMIASLMLIIKQSGVDGYIGVILFMSFIGAVRLLSALPSACCRLGGRVAEHVLSRPSYRASSTGSMILRDSGQRVEIGQSSSHASTAMEGSVSVVSSRSEETSALGRSAVASKTEVASPRERLNVEEAYHLMS